MAMGVADFGVLFGGVACCALLLHLVQMQRLGLPAAEAVGPPMPMALYTARSISKAASLSHIALYAGRLHCTGSIVLQDKLLSVDLGLLLILAQAKGQQSRSCFAQGSRLGSVGKPAFHSGCCSQLLEALPTSLRRSLLRAELANMGSSVCQCRTARMCDKSHAASQPRLYIFLLVVCVCVCVCVCTGARSSLA